MSMAALVTLSEDCWEGTNSPILANVKTPKHKRAHNALSLCDLGYNNGLIFLRIGTVRVFSLNALERSVYSLPCMFYLYLWPTLSSSLFRSFATVFILFIYDFTVTICLNIHWSRKEQSTSLVGLSGSNSGMSCWASKLGDTHPWWRVPSFF